MNDYKDPDYWEYFAELVYVEPPEHGVLTTYNFHAAFLNWHDCHGTQKIPPFHKMNPIQKFIHLMNQTPGGLAIIMTPPNNNEDRIIKEVQLISSNFKNIQFLWNDHNHTKMLFLAYKDHHRIWNGSQNFHGSNSKQKYHEMMTEVTKEETKQCEKLVKHLVDESYLNEPSGSSIEITRNTSSLGKTDKLHTPCQ
jgi:hypothetical protein